MTGAPREEFAGRSAVSREALTRTERLLVTMFVTMFATMLAAGALGFTTISGQLLHMQEQIGNLSERITRVEERIAGVEERLTRVEERITSVEERLTSVETLIQTHLVPRPAASPAAGP